MLFAASVLCGKAMFSFFRSLFSTRMLSLIVPETLLIFACYILAAYYYSGADPSVFLFYDNGLLQIALVVAGVLIGLQLNKLYVQVGVRSKMVLGQQLCLTLGVTFLLESLIGYLRYPELVLPPSIMLLGSAMVLATLLVWRMTLQRSALEKRGSQKYSFLRHWSRRARGRRQPGCTSRNGLRHGRLHRRRFPRRYRDQWSPRARLHRRSRTHRFRSASRSPGNCSQRTARASPCTNSSTCSFEAWKLSA